MKPGDLVFWEDPEFGRHRFWLIESVLLGALGHESLVRMRTLNHEAGCDEDGNAQPSILVPEVLIRGMVFARDAERTAQTITVGCGRELVSKPTKQMIEHLVGNTHDEADAKSEPKPEPETIAEVAPAKPDPKPPAPKKTTAAPRSKLKKGPWSDDELRELSAHMNAGKTAAQIAPLIGRDLKSVQNRMFRIRQNMPKEKPRDVPPPVRRPDPVSVPATPVTSVPDRNPAAPAFDDHVPYNLRQLRMRLDALGNEAPWTLETDLKMAIGLSRGGGAGNVAADLGLEKEAVVQRWRQLCPDVTIDEQKLLLKELMRRVETISAPADGG